MTISRDLERGRNREERENDRGSGWGVRGREREKGGERGREREKHRERG